MPIRYSGWRAACRSRIAALVVIVLAIPVLGGCMHAGRDVAARHGAKAFEGIWVIADGPAFPGPRMMLVEPGGSGPHGDITTDWYGDLPMNDLRIDGDVAHFMIDNGNAALPAKPWTATLSQGKLHIVGDIWATHVDVVATRGDRDDAQRLAFPSEQLPAWQPLKPDGLAATPPMGWSSWNTFAEHIDDKTVRAIADALVASGLRDAGYVYVNIDDGWQGERDAKGVLHPNDRFPDMKALADYVHARGLKLGIYSSPGPKTCAGYAGSYGHVEQDAETWASWGIDYLKYDLCSGEGIFRKAEDVRRAYLKMGMALRASGRPIVYSLCQYGRDDVGRWGRDVGGHLWRTTGDIQDKYAVMAKIGFDKDGDPANAGPGGWNDPDMLEVGNGGMSDDEYRTHMTLWAIQAAPLLLGNDLRTMAPQTLALLRNRDVIAIDQDRGGVQGRRVRRDGDLDVWRKPLADGSVALALFNRGNNAFEAHFDRTDTAIDAAEIEIRDVWNGQSLASAQRTVTLPAHGVALLRVRASEHAPR